MATIFTKPLKKLISTLVSVSIAVTSVMPSMAQAQSSLGLCNQFSAKDGSDDSCAVVPIGGVNVTYPKLQWDFQAEMPLSPKHGGKALETGSETERLANRVALALNKSAEEVATANSMAPSNVPYVLARYNPADATLRIDIFKLEKVMKPGGYTAGMYHATFTPHHGDYWRANRSYISPEALQGGVTPGRNPFAAFAKPGSEVFHDISFEGAKVAVGHAMRLAGSPLGILTHPEARLSSRTKKSSSFFKKKVETWVYGHAKTKWYLAQPADILSRSTTLQMSSICTSDVTSTSCPVYEAAVSGVAFEHFEGGTLDSAEERWTLDYQKKSGFTFIGALVIGLALSFSVAGALAAVSTGGLATGISAGTVAGGAAGATGLTGTIGAAVLGAAPASSLAGLVSSGFAGALAVESVALGVGIGMTGGASLGSFGAGGMGLLDNVKGAVGVGRAEARSMSKYETKLNGILAPRVAGKVHNVSVSSAPALNDFKSTVMGNCELNQRAGACANSGILPRIDQYQEMNSYEFVRDNKDYIVRDTYESMKSNGNK